MRKFLVQHDYGMGALLWWVWAESAEEIVETLAEVEVVPGERDDEDIEEFRLDALPAGSDLAERRDERTAQRAQPGYGLLAGRSRVCLRDADEAYEGTVFLSEVGPDGRMLRQVEQRPDGTAVRGLPFEINPPIDLRDPAYVSAEISAVDFERAWAAAVADPES